jgi:hypothetical protein
VLHAAPEYSVASTPAMPAERARRTESSSSASSPPTTTSRGGKPERSAYRQWGGERCARVGTVEVLARHALQAGLGRCEVCLGVRLERPSGAGQVHPR